MFTKRSVKEWTLRLILLLLGLSVAHLGITLFLLSSLGSDPFTTMIQGISGHLGLSVGVTHMIALSILVVVMLLATKGYVKAGTVVCAVCGGPIIDFFTWILGDLVSVASPMWLRIVVAAAGCVILAAGMSLVIRSDAGTGPNDLIAVILTDRLKKAQFRWVRMVCDAVFTLAGFLLGGVVGIGTLLAVLLVGPAAQLIMPLSQKLVNRCLRAVKLPVQL